MRHADIRTTFNIYGDVVTDEMTTASERVAEMPFVGTERKQSAVNRNSLKELAPQVGLEPTTLRLTVARTANRQSPAIAVDSENKSLTVF